MNKQISLIVSGKNDKYDDDPSIDPVSDFYFKRVCKSVNEFAQYDQFNVVFVDWCSDEDKMFKPHLDNNIKYIYIPQNNITDVLKKYQYNPLKYYEYMAKDIGAYAATDDLIIFTNPDNFFPKSLHDEIINNIPSDTDIITATRVGVKKEAIFIDNVAENSKNIGETFVCSWCIGDFTYMTKKGYDNIGGYMYKAGADVHLTQSARENNFNIRHFNNVVYHIDHTNNGNSHPDIHWATDQIKTDIKNSLITVMKEIK